MLSNYGLVQVLRVEADMKGTIRSVAVHEGRHPLSRWGDRYYHSLGNHVIEGVLSLFLVLYGYLPPCMLDQGYIRVGPDGVGTRHVAEYIK